LIVKQKKYSDKKTCIFEEKNKCLLSPYFIRDLVSPFVSFEGIFFGR